jgi:hypothetical protein
MSEGEVRAALEATAAWDQRFQVHITGGEPFLNFPLLRHAVVVSREMGIPTYVETNAGWCVREDLVEERFTALRDAGLQSILISCSPFHAESIPPKRTMLGIKKAVEIFGRRGVIVYLSEWIDQLRAFGMEEPTPLTAYESAFGRRQAGRLFWEGYGLISGGRSGYRLGHLIEGKKPESFQGENCRRDLLFAHHSHFDLYGNFISGFCGGLTVGDWHDLPELLETFARGDYPATIETLIHAGPYGLYLLARDSYGYQAREEGYAGKCHLCVDVRKHLVEHGDIPELNPGTFYDMI